MFFKICLFCISGLSEACIETILHKYETGFDESGLFRCDIRIIDVATRTIIREVGIPLGADKKTVIETVRKYGRRHLVDFDRNRKYQCSEFLLIYLTIGTCVPFSSVV